jgi:N-acetylmuramoyl-L-alanine amidase
VEANSFEDFNDWCKQFPNARLIGIEDTTKAFPKLPDYGVVVVEPEKPTWEKTDWIPFAKKASKSMKTVQKTWPKYLIIHWTAGEPSQGGEDGIASGVKSGYTYAFLPRDGQLWQGAPTHAGGYHAGNASVSSYDCLGVEVANAGKVSKIGDLFVPWFAKKDDGTINKARCIPAEQVIYDNDGPEDDGSFQGYYQKYTEPQVNSLTKLALYCVQVLGIPVENIRGHDEIATPHGRKVDPGFSIGDNGMVGFRNKIKTLIQQGKKWNEM